MVAELRSGEEAGDEGLTVARVGSGLIGCLPWWRFARAPALSGSRKRSLINFVKARRDQRFQRRHSGPSFTTARTDRDRSSGRGREHHQAHDRCSADRLVAAGDPNVGVKFFYGLHEFCRCARVQAFLVANNESANDRLTSRRLRVEHASVVMRAVVNAVIAAVVGVVLNAVIAAAIMAGGFHLPDKTRLAMVTYFRPASCAAATASGSGHSSRTLASFTSIGRLIPARTSTLGRLMTEIARFDGVPPNMSVRMATPSPLSTRRTASIMSMRRSSTSSSGPMVTASIWLCGPTTCSNAARNSTASRPWVTSTRPIIELPAGASPLRRTKGCSS